MEVDIEDDDETIMYSKKDDGTGTSTSKNPLPTALTPIEEIAKKLFKGEHPESADYEENTSDTIQIER